jgi:hypothetical protein
VDAHCLILNRHDYTVFYVGTRISLGLPTDVRHRSIEEELDTVESGRVQPEINSCPIRKAYQFCSRGFFVVSSIGGNTPSCQENDETEKSDREKRCP